MKPVSVVEGQMVPLPHANIDTDQIIPKQFLKGVKRTGLGPNLFYNWAYDEEGERESGFVLNRPEYAEAAVLVAGPNFGCGSSREHAVWSLADAGFEAILAPSFGPILENNCYQNGLLPVVLGDDDAEEFAKLAADPANSVTIDPSPTSRLGGRANGTTSSRAAEWRTRATSSFSKTSWLGPCPGSL